MTACNPDTCKNCKKEGLSILPLRYGTVPLYNQDGALTKMPDLPGELGMEVTNKHLKQHQYALRVLRQGYIYMLRYDDDGSKEWFGWEVTEDGYCIPFDPVLDPEPAKPAGPFMCSRKATNVPATMISVKNPETSPIVYMMFAEHALTKDKIKEYQAGKNNVLNERMQFFSPKAFMLQKGAGTGGVHTVKIDEIEKCAIDYNAAYFPFFAYKDKVTGENRDHARFALRPRHYMVRELHKRFEKPQGPYGIAIALWDAVGITQELNHARNMMAERASKIAGHDNEQKMRERITADIIESIRLSAEKDPGPFWNRNFGPERYLRHIDQGKWRQARKVGEEFLRVDAVYLETSFDYVEWKESNNWKWIARHEYDLRSNRSSLDLERMVSGCVDGSGATEHERDKVWRKVCSLSDTDKDNWLTRALTGLNADFQSYFDANKIWYREYDSFKAFATVLKDTVVAQAPTLAMLHGKLRYQRAANEATSALIETLAGVMLHLSITNKAVYQKTMLSVLHTFIVRADVIPTPVLVRGTAAQIKQALLELVAGTPRTTPPLKIAPNVSTKRATYMATEGNVGKRGWQLSQGVNGAVLADIPEENARIREVAAWVITRVTNGTRKLKPQDLNALSLTTVDLTTVGADGARPNPFRVKQIERLGSHVDSMLGAGALLFQVWTFQMMLDGWKNNAAGSVERFEAGESMFTAALSALSALFEVRAAHGVLTGAARETIAFRIRLAARLGAAANFADGIYLLYKGGRSLIEGKEENRKSSLWIVGSGAFMLASVPVMTQLGAVGAASALGSGAAAGAAGAGGAGAGLLALGGPATLTLLVVCLVGGAMYMSWQAAVTDKDNLLPVEYWLDNCVFGLRKLSKHKNAKDLPFYDTKAKAILPFTSLALEQEALQRIFLAATGKLETDRVGSVVTASYEVCVPRFIKGSELELKFAVQVNGKTLEVKKIKFTRDEKLERVNHEGTYDRATLLRDLGARTKLDAVNKMVFIEGSFTMMSRVMGQFYARQFELTATYKPDPVLYPGLETTFTDKAD